MAPHMSVPVTASEVFSASDSTVARAIPSASSASGSREHSHGTSSRAASISPAESRSAIRSPVRRRVVPPSDAHVVAVSARVGATVLTAAVSTTGAATAIVVKATPRALESA